MSLKVPQSQVEGLKALVRLSPEAKGRLLKALRETQPTLQRNKIEETATRSSGIPAGDVHEIMKVLTTLYIVREERAVPLDKFVEELCVAATETKAPELTLTGKARDEFRDYMRELLSLDRTVGVTAKALSLLNEYKLRFCGARIMTDLRPIFGSDPSKLPLANVLVHTLRIQYHQGQNLEEEYVALDTSDVKELRLLLDRALQKEAALEELSKAAGLLCLKVDGQ